MKNSIQKYRVSILVTLAILTYMYMITSAFINNFDAFLLGYKQGRESACFDTCFIKKEVPKHVFFVNVKPKEYILAFPDTIYDKKSNTKLPFKSRNITVASPHDREMSDYSKKYSFVQHVLTFLYFILIIIIPIYFYRLIVFIKKDRIFKPSSIKQCRILGVSLVLFYILGETSNYIGHLIHVNEFSFSDYAINYSLTSPYPLIIGLAALIIAEAFSKGYKMKQEQDLTI